MLAPLLLALLLQEASPPPAAWPEPQTALHVASRQTTYEVTVHTRGRSVSVTWLEDPTGSGSPLDFKTSRQVESVDFWPTCAKAIGGEALVVAGKRVADGRAVVERWTFSFAEGSLRPAFAREVVYVHPRAEEAVPRHAFPVLVPGGRSPTRVYLHVASPEAIHVLDLETGGLGEPVLDVVDAPRIDETDWQSVEAAEHVTLGYVYLYFCPEALATGYVLVDADRDGILDYAADLPSLAATHGWGQEQLLALYE